MSKRASIVRRLGSGAVGSSRETAPSENVAAGADLDRVAEIALPRDHPKWLRDRFVISAATRAALSGLKDAAIRLLGFWDHRTHRLEIEDATILVDDSGAYRSV